MTSEMMSELKKWCEKQSNDFRNKKWLQNDPQKKYNV